MGCWENCALVLFASTMTRLTKPFSLLLSDWSDALPVTLQRKCKLFICTKKLATQKKKKRKCIWGCEKHTADYLVSMDEPLNSIAYRMRLFIHLNYYFIKDIFYYVWARPKILVQSVVYGDYVYKYMWQKILVRTLLIW